MTYSWSTSHSGQNECTEGYFLQNRNFDLFTQFCVLPVWWGRSVIFQKKSKFFISNSNSPCFPEQFKWSQLYPTRRLHGDIKNRVDSHDHVIGAFFRKYVRSRAHGDFVVLVFLLFMYVIGGFRKFQWHILDLQVIPVKMSILKAIFWKIEILTCFPVLRVAGLVGGGAALYFKKIYFFLFQIRTLHVSPSNLNGHTCI